MSISPPKEKQDMPCELFVHYMALTGQVLYMLIDVTVLTRHGSSLDMGTKVIDPCQEVWKPEIKVGNEETRKKQNMLILIFGPKNDVMWPSWRKG